MSWSRESDPGNCSVVIETHLDAPIESAWEAITSADFVSQWLVPARIEPWLGGTVRFSTGTEEATGSITRFEPPRLLEFSWRSVGTTNSTVRLELTREGKGCRLRLLHALDSDAPFSKMGELWGVGIGQLGAWLSLGALRGVPSQPAPGLTSGPPHRTSGYAHPTTLASHSGRFAWVVPIALSIVIVGAVAVYAIDSGFATANTRTSLPGPIPPRVSPPGTGHAPNSTGLSPLLRDLFWNDSALNSSLWAVNGPAANASLTHWAAQSQFPVTPQSAFLRGSGLELSGVVSNFTWASIETQQAFVPPFIAQVTVKATVSNGNPIAFLISPTNNSTGVGIDGNMNSNNPYYRLGALAEIDPGLWISWGNGTPSPLLNTWYTLGISVSAHGDATVTIEMGDSVQARASFSVGIASYHVILGMFVAQPPPGNGPNSSVWNSAYVDGTAAVSPPGKTT